MEIRKTTLDEASGITEQTEPVSMVDSVGEKGKIYDADVVFTLGDNGEIKLLDRDDEKVSGKAAYTTILSSPVVRKARQ